VPPETIAILDAYITITTGAAGPTNRTILPISRSESASISQPQAQGAPTSYWFDRLLSPTITLWPVPDGAEVSLSYWRVRQIQDANLANGATVEVPIYFLEAFATGLARRLAMIWKPDKVSMLKSFEDEAWQIATNQNVESAMIYISPQVGGYYRP
jgi:hypothetical protein